MLRTGDRFMRFLVNMKMSWGMWILVNQNPGKIFLDKKKYLN